MARSPSFQFYPGDWLRNDVSGCSLEAQGLWLRMMIMMHDAQTYGQLVLNNAPMPPQFIAKKAGISLKKFNYLLKELDFAGVVNRKENGVIYSGRMERDERARQQNRERQADFQSRRQEETNATPNAKITPPLTHKITVASRRSSSSSSLSVSSSEDLKRLIDSACEKNPKSDPRLIEIAIIETLIRRNGDNRPIKSIAYFSEEIKAICSKSKSLSDKTIDAMLERRRQQIGEKVTK